MDNMKLFLGKKVDLAEWTQFFAFDVVGELAFGKNFGLLDAGRDHEGLIEWVYLLLTSQASLGWFWRDGDPSKYRLFRNMLNKGYLKTAGKVLGCWPRPEVEKRVRNKINIRTTSDRNDLFAHFLQMKNPDGTPVPYRDMFGESMNVVAAGADTTAISIRAVIRYVASNPRVYRKLQREIDEANKAGLLAQVVRFEQVQGLTYFNAVVKEALRLYPAESD
ncbi:hypothetical protein SLS60_004412 [Paraconiothyrium brasiliense]|uniref:Cytochrome P450 n=1 Tax=Paraconiothyrium brasiliense TaxID=300254 RepID=A0ABR3RLW5_9PLEO